MGYSKKDREKIIERSAKRMAEKVERNRFYNRGQLESAARSAASQGLADFHIGNWFKGAGLFILFCIGGLVVAALIFNAIDSYVKSLCEHESYNIEEPYYDRANHKLVLKCENCEKEHSFDVEIKEEVIKNPTCTETGIVQEYWKIPEYPTLNTSFLRDVSKLDHDYVVKKAGYPSTCVEHGLSDELICKGCREIVDSEPLPLADHKLVSSSYVAPTCHSLGYSVGQSCSECNQVFVEVEEIPMLPHNYQDTIISATYSTTGYTNHQCKDCEYYYNDNFVEPLFANYATYYELGSLTSTYIAITGAKTGVSELVIPESIDGIPVKLIDEKAFYENTSLVSVTMPDCIEEIKPLAFSFCNNLKTINIPSSLTAIGGGAFYHCNSLDIDLVIPGSVSSIDGNTFTGCSSLISVVLEDGVSSISGYAFSDCENLSSISLPYSLNSIAQNAFDNCNKILEVKGNYELYYNWPSSVIIKNKDFSETSFFNQDDCLFLHNVDKDEYYMVLCEKQGTDIVIDATINGKPYTLLDNCLERLRNVETLTMHNISGTSLYRLFNKKIPTSLTSLIVDAEDFIKTGYFRGCSNLKNVTITDKVTGIGRAFFNCDNIEELTMPGNLETIGYLFYDPNQLYYDTSARIFIPDSLRKVNVTGTSVTDHFAYNIDSIEEIELADGIEEIGDNAFYKCVTLNKIKMPLSLKTIGNRAFYDCHSLNSIVINENVNSIKTSAFEKCNNLFIVYNLSDLVLIEGKTDNGWIAYYCKCIASSLDANPTINELGDYTYIDDGNQNYSLISYKGSNTDIVLPDNINGKSYVLDNQCFNNSNITSIVIPSGVSYIEPSAFDGCKNLVTVSINSNIDVIEENMFNNCSKLKEVTYSSEIKEIKTNAFNNCSVLETLQIGSSLQEVWPLAFANCNKLTSIDVSSIVTLHPQAFMNFKGINEITIPSSMEVIGESTFEGCTSLSSVIFNSNLIEISERAFYGCTNLEKVILPEGLRYIRQSSFENCSNLKEIYIPSSVMNISIEAFQKSYSKVEKLTIPMSFNIAKIFNYAGLWGTSTISEGLKQITITGEGELPSLSLEACQSTEIVILDDRITSLASQSLYAMYSLKEVYLSDNIEFIGTYNFTVCPLLEKIHLDNNSKYEVIDNAKGLVNKQTKTLMFAAKDLIIPSFVERIGSYAYHSSTIETLTIPENILYIDAYAFNNCSKLVELNLPTTLKEIGESAFNKCNALPFIVLPASLEKIGLSLAGNGTYRKLCYYGSMDMWNKIEGSDLYYQFYYIYSEEKPSEKYKYWHYIDGTPVIWE